MQPSSIHSNFFSSLRQVEKRLKLENPSQNSIISLPQPLGQQHQKQCQSDSNSNHTETESLGSPLYLNIENQDSTKNTEPEDDSEAPQEFLSNSMGFPQTHQDALPHNPPEWEENEIDDIQMLIQLLGLSDFAEKELKKAFLGLKCCGGNRECCCDGEFYEKIVGVRGPKCMREVERMDGWINHFCVDRAEERKEPMRLAHLLLGKAAFVSESVGDYEGPEFPSTIYEFLHIDPPLH